MTKRATEKLNPRSSKCGISQEQSDENMPQKHLTLDLINYALAYGFVTKGSISHNQLIAMDICGYLIFECE